MMMMQRLLPVLTVAVLAPSLMADELPAPKVFQVLYLNNRAGELTPCG